MSEAKFKSVARFAVIAAVSLIGSTAITLAADLGGNCCADLEERVAELEATTARKGNRKVSLEISGHVNESFVFYRDGTDEGFAVMTNDHSRTRFRFKGDAKINADWSAGFLMEFGIRGTNRSDRITGADLNEKPGFDVRHEALYIASKSFGTIWLGHTSSATDGITEICLGCFATQDTGKEDTLGSFVARTSAGVALGSWRTLGSSQGALNNGEGDRRDVVKYETPSIVGFKLSAAAGSDQFYDAAIRYSGEFGGFRIAAGVGYQWSTEQPATADKGFADNCLAVGGRVDCGALGVSGGVMHVSTGLYVHGSYGYIEDNNRLSDVDRDETWYVTAGINRTFFSLGKTNIYGDYLEARREIGLGAGARTGVRVYSAGIVQEIDAAASEIYLYWQRFEGLEAASAAVELDAVVGGMRMKF